MSTEQEKSGVKDILQQPWCLVTVGQNICHFLSLHSGNLKKKSAAVLDDLTSSVVFSIHIVGVVCKNKVG